MSDYLHQYNVEVAAARKAHRAAVRTAADLYAQAHAVLMTAHEQRLANAARTFRDAMAAAEQTYIDATARHDNEPPF